MIFSFVAALLIGVVAWYGAAAGFQYLLGMALPLCAVAVFVGGMVWKIVYWAKSPVPFAIPTTGGQEKSLDFIKPSRLDAPSGKAGVIGRMMLEVLLFRSLFRNTYAEVRSEGPRIIYFSSKWLWVFALLFHYTFLLIFMRHFRFFLEPVPLCLTWMEFFDGIMQVGIPRLFMSDVLIIVALGFLFARRFMNPRLRYISLANDYFPLFLLLGLAGSGIIMRYFDKIDVAQAKVFAMGLVRFSPQAVDGLGPIFFVHLAFLSALLMYFPFSKLMHMGGIFLSPTRNMPCNTRAVRHENPWHTPAKFHTYAAYEDDFREAMEEAGLPVEKTSAEAEAEREAFVQEPCAQVADDADDADDEPSPIQPAPAQ